MTEDGFITEVSQNSMYFHGHTARLDYGGFATAEDEGTRIGEAIGDDVSVVMLENHGVLVVGTDVADAWHKLYFLERACQVQVLAQSTGRPLIRVTDEVAMLTASQWERDAGAAPSLFAAMKRRLDRENPGYQL